MLEARKHELQWLQIFVGFPVEWVISSVPFACLPDSSNSFLEPRTSDAMALTEVALPHLSNKTGDISDDVVKGVAVLMQVGIDVFKLYKGAPFSPKRCSITGSQYHTPIWQ